MGRIITFYSYKGGVGRTFALANIAILLAQRGKRVLMVDWDLEAPGLHRYFQPHVALEGNTRKGLIYLLQKASTSIKADWKPHITEIQLDGIMPISLISSGDQASGYADLVRAFSWTRFFEKQHGGAILDRWTSQWQTAYDFVLLDSRTGISDAGGVCTILLPEILVLVFTANEQSFTRGVQIAFGVQQARRELAVHRPPLAILPLLGRFDGREEVDEAQRWLDRFAIELKPFYDDWLPGRFTPRQVLELTKIPYIAKFSFGEPLPVVTQGISDPDGPGFYLNKVAGLLANDFRSVERMLEPEGVPIQDPDTITNAMRLVSDLFVGMGKTEEATQLISSLPSDMVDLKQDLQRRIDGIKRPIEVDRFDTNICGRPGAPDTGALTQKWIGQKKLDETLKTINQLPDQFKEFANLAQKFLGQLGEAERLRKIQYLADTALMEFESDNARLLCDLQREGLQLSNIPNLIGPDDIITTGLSTEGTLRRLIKRHLPSWLSGNGFRSLVNGYSRRTK
jgi:hypothetical protein